MPLYCWLYVVTVKGTVLYVMAQGFSYLRKKLRLCRVKMSLFVSVIVMTRQLINTYRATHLYRASHVLVDWVLLTWIWDVPLPCLGSR